jgi:hypothetical protein
VTATTLRMGNPDPRERVTDDPVTGEWHWEAVAYDGEAVTETPIPDGYPLMEVLSSVTLPGGIWERHSAADAPSWVSSDRPGLADTLAEHYGCPVVAFT